MTRSPQELAQTVKRSVYHDVRGGRATMALDALADLVALAEAGERAREALRLLVDAVERDAATAAYKADLGASEWIAFVRAETFEVLKIARAALGEES